MTNDESIREIYEKFYIITPLDYKYYNVITTDEEIILDFINRSYKPWILRTGIYKKNTYDGLLLEDIKNRSEENIVLKREDVKNIDFSNRTLLKNAYLKIDLKIKNEPLILITKDKLHKNIMV